MFECVKKRYNLNQLDSMSMSINLQILSRFESDARPEAALVWHLAQPIECLGKSHFALPFYVPFQSFSFLPP